MQFIPIIQQRPRIAILIQQRSLVARCREIRSRTSGERIWVYRMVKSAEEVA